MRESTYQRMIEKSTHLYAVLRFDCVLKEFNPAWCLHLGLQPSQLLGSDWLSLLSEEDRPPIAIQLSQAWYNEEEVLLEARLQTPKKALPFSWRLVPCPDESQWLLFGHEVAASRTSATRLRKLEDELSLARNQAHQAQLTQSTFLANMSHELRTPLNAIIGYSEILGEDLEDLDQPQLSQDAERVLAASRHLLRLVDDLLDLSQMEGEQIELSPSTFSMSGLLEEVVSMLSPLIQQRRNRIDLDEGAGEILADRGYLRQVLLNLLGNANKFTSRGAISMRTWKYKDHGHEWFALSVRDTGVGIPADRMETLFRPLQRAERAVNNNYDNTGLGLALSRKMCRSMGGDLSARSEPGKGSTFLVRFPLRLSTSGDSLPEIPPKTPPQARRDRYQTSSESNPAVSRKRSDDDYPTYS